MIRCHLHSLCVCFGVTIQVNIYPSKGKSPRPVGNPPLNGEQVRLNLVFISLIIIITSGWRILWVFFGSS